MRNRIYFMTALSVAPLQGVFGVSDALAQSFERDAWSGGYLGVTAGAGIGGIGGFNTRIGNFNLSFELDGQVGGQTQALTLSSPTGFDRLNWSAAGRTRIGGLAWPSLFLYGIVGLGVADIDFKAAGGGLQSETRGGVQFGLGAEWKVLDQVSLRLDYTETKLDWAKTTHSLLQNERLSAIQAGVMFRF